MEVCTKYEYKMSKTEMLKQEMFMLLIAFLVFIPPKTIFVFEELQIK